MVENADDQERCPEDIVIAKAEVPKSTEITTVSLERVETTGGCTSPFSNDMLQLTG